MTYDNILYDTNDRVATVTLNRPEKLNALSNELRGEMFHALKEAEADSSIGVVIIFGLSCTETAQWNGDVLALGDERAQDPRRA